MEFHRVLKEKRKEFGLTQEELAEKLQVSRSAISNWEIGRNYPDIQTLISLAKTFNVSLDYLLICSQVLPTNSVEDQINQQQIRI